MNTVLWEELLGVVILTEKEICDEQHPEKDGDPLWHPTQRESMKDVCERAYDLLCWLRARPEKEIVLSAHSSILFTTLNAVINPHDAGGQPGEGLFSWFLTGEMRSVRLCFTDRENAHKSKRAKTDE